MALKFNTTTTLDKLARAVDRTFDKQVRFATSVTINKLASQSKDALRGEMESVFESPRPYTLNSLFVKPSNRTNLSAIVGHKDRVSRGNPAGNYLQAQIEGGPRQSTPFERLIERAESLRGKLVPSKGALKDAFGGVRKQVRDRLVDAIEGKSANDPRGYFVIRPGARSHLSPGVYERIPVKTKTGKKYRRAGKVTAGGSRLRTIYQFKSSVTYTKRYDLLGPVNKIIGRNFDREFNSAMDAALRSAIVKV